MSTICLSDPTTNCFGSATVSTTSPNGRNPSKITNTPTSLRFTRASRRISGLDPTIPGLPSLILRHGIPVRGAIYVGAHTGEEVDTYRKAGVPRMIVIEANPSVFADLQKRLGSSPDVVAVERGVADVNEIRRFHVTNASQSSSLLPLGRHAQSIHRSSSRAKSAFSAHGSTISWLRSEKTGRGTISSMSTFRARN